MLHRHTVGIIGTGQVGMAAASALFQQRIANELIPWSTSTVVGRRARPWI